MTAEPLLPGWCSHCRVECRDCTGAEIWPDREDLADKVIWRCPLCRARVGSHPDGKPLGTAANDELRRARGLLHGLIDPLWEKAADSGQYGDPRGIEDKAERMKALAIIKRTARVRLYRYMAAHMGLTKDECHVAMFDLERCRDAWRAMRHVDYAEIRRWAKAHPEPKDSGKTKRQRAGVM